MKDIFSPMFVSIQSGFPDMIEHFTLNVGAFQEKGKVIKEVEQCLHSFLQHTSVANWKQ